MSLMFDSSNGHLFIMVLKLYMVIWLRYGLSFFSYDVYLYKTLIVDKNLPMIEL